MGLVVDELEARNTPCKCVRIHKDDGTYEDICWSKGVIGILSDEQEKLYCPSKMFIPIEDTEIDAVMDTLAELSHEAKGMPLPDRLKYIKQHFDEKLKEKLEEKEKQGFVYVGWRR